MEFSLARKVLRAVVVCVITGGLVACGGGGGGGSGSGGGGAGAPIGAANGGDPPAPPKQSNAAPVANAGDDLTVFKNEQVQVSGKASADADGDTLTYSWVQQSGPAVTLSNATSVNASFVAPAVSGTVVLALTVNDGRTASTADAVAVTIQNRVPTAAAQASIDSQTNTVVTLVASGSSDPDQDALTYEWKQGSTR